MLWSSCRILGGEGFKGVPLAQPISCETWMAKTIGAGVRKNLHASLRLARLASLGSLGARRSRTQLLSHRGIFDRNCSPQHNYSTVAANYSTPLLVGRKLFAQRCRKLEHDSPDHTVSDHHLTPRYGRKTMENSRKCRGVINILE